MEHYTICKIEETNNCKSVKSHAGNVLLLVTFDPGFPGLAVEHFRVKFGDPTCIGFRDAMPIKETDTPTDKRM